MVTTKERIMLLEKHVSELMDDDGAEIITNGRIWIVVERDVGFWVCAPRMSPLFCRKLWQAQKIGEKLA